MASEREKVSCDFPSASQCVFFPTATGGGGKLLRLLDNNTGSELGLEKRFRSKKIGKLKPLGQNKRFKAFEPKKFQ